MALAARCVLVLVSATTHAVRPGTQRFRVPSTHRAPQSRVVVRRPNVGTRETSLQAERDQGTGGQQQQHPCSSTPPPPPHKTHMRRRDAVDLGLTAWASSCVAACSSFPVVPPDANAAAGVNAGARGSVVTIDEDEPFRAALDQIARLLDKLGVEGAVSQQKGLETQAGPKIERSFAVGLKPGTDRLAACPESGEACLSSSRVETKNKAISPYVFFDQKGDSVGRLLELLYQSQDAQLLTARGNFFTGQGVYVLAELVDKGASNAVHDVEFQFLPGILESVVDVRIVLREGGSDAQVETATERQKLLVSALADRLDWLPLADADKISGALPSDRKEIVDASRTEMRYRDRFEADMERADAELAVAMEKERKRIDELKREVRELLDALAKQEDARMNEYLELRSRTAETRDEYERGVAKRLGGYANTGRYAGSQNVRLSSSFAGLINSQDDTLAKIYDQAASSGSSDRGDDTPNAKQRKGKK